MECHLTSHNTSFRFLLKNKRLGCIRTDGSQKASFVYYTTVGSVIRFSTYELDEQKLWSSNTVPILNYKVGSLRGLIVEQSFVSIEADRFAVENTTFRCNTDGFTFLKCKNAMVICNVVAPEGSPTLKVSLEDSNLKIEVESSAFLELFAKNSNATVCGMFETKLICDSTSTVQIEPKNRQPVQQPVQQLRTIGNAIRQLFQNAVTEEQMLPLLRLMIANGMATIVPIFVPRQEVPILTPIDWSRLAMEDKSLKRDEQDSECYICFVRNKNAVFNCGHKTCVECCKRMFGMGNDLCSICRGKIEQVRYNPDI